MDEACEQWRVKEVEGDRGSLVGTHLLLGQQSCRTHPLHTLQPTVHCYELRSKLEKKVTSIRISY